MSEPAFITVWTMFSIVEVIANPEQRIFHIFISIFSYLILLMGLPFNKLVFKGGTLP